MRYLWVALGRCNQVLHRWKKAEQLPAYLRACPGAYLRTVGGGPNSHDRWKSELGAAVGLLELRKCHVGCSNPTIACGPGAVEMEEPLEGGSHQIDAYSSEC